MRKAKPQKRVILPDPVYGEVMVAKFVNHLMLDGKKNTAYSVFYGALGVVDQKMKGEEKSALEIWKQPYAHFRVHGHRLHQLLQALCRSSRSRQQEQDRCHELFHFHSVFIGYD